MLATTTTGASHSNDLVPHFSNLDFLTQCIFFAAARVAFPSTANAKVSMPPPPSTGTAVAALADNLHPNVAPFRRWMKLGDIFAVLNDRALIDAKVQDFFGAAPAAHEAAMDLLVAPRE